MMKNIRRIVLTIFFLGCLISARATWSIILVDSATGTIGIAGASCTPSVYGIGAIVPGKGAIIVQAWSNGAARREGVKMISMGATSQDIMARLRNPYFDPEHQQYAVVILSATRTAAVYTGAECTDEKGTLTGDGVSIQGNTLLHRAELDSVMAAVVEGRRQQLPLQDILLLALEAGARAGGDKRCGTRRASSAFITVMHKDDDPRKPWLNLVVNQEDDSTNAVERLRQVFDRRFALKGEQ